MPREVYLEPSGSPFVNNAPFNYDLDQSMAGDSTLTDLSFQDNDNLLNASGFAGLADVTVGGLGDDTSMMNMPDAGGESADMLMGVKGDEFLEDDSMAFELSKSTTTTRARAKLEQSTSAPPEPEPVPVEEEKPRRKKSTRSRSSSPSKKRSSAVTTPVVEEPAAFPATQMDTMPEEPEPEPEPEPKLRRSPRKARSTSTRLGASVSTGVSPFASTSSQPSAQPTPEKTTESAPSDSSPAPEAQAGPEPKSKRSSRVVGRSKSKSRGKSAKFEEPLNDESPKPEEPVLVAEPVATPVVEREPTPVVETTPTIARETSPVPLRSPAPVQTTPATAPQTSPPTSSPTPQFPIQEASPAPPVVFPPSRPAPTTRQSLASVPTSQPAPVPAARQSLAPVPTSRQSLAPTPGPTPFKFNLPPSFGRKAQSLAPTPATPVFPTTRTSAFPTTPSFPAASTPSLSNPVSALPSPALALATPGPAIAFASPSPAIASDPPSATAPNDKEEDLKYEQPSKEEEEEAVAIAMRITRRDSSIFAALMSPLRMPFAKEHEADMSGVEGPGDSSSSGEMETDENVAATEPAPVPMRTRVGRGSTRVKSRAGVAVAVMGPVAEDEDVERIEGLLEPQGQEHEQDDFEEEKHILEGHQDAAVPVNFNSRSPSPTPPPPPPEEPAPSALPRGNKPKPSFGARTRTTRASMSAAQPTRTTRSTRRSEVQPPSSRGLGTTTTIQETLIEKPTEDQGAEADTDKPTEDVSTPIRAADPPASSTTLQHAISAPHGIISTTPLDSPVVSAPEEHTPPPLKAAAPGNKGPQRAVASQQNASSQSQPRRAAHKPSSSGPAKPPSTGSAKPSSTGAKPASTEGPQRVAGPVQKPASTRSAASRKPASTGNKPPSATREAAAEQNPSPVPDPDVSKDEPEPEIRAVRALPRRASRSSQVPTIMEDSMEIERDEIRESDISAERTTPVQIAAPTFMSTSIWPRDPAPNPFAPVVSNDDSPRANKRRAPSPEPEPESVLEVTDADSPNKRVRFTAVLVAGPTPGIGRVLQMPKPSLKQVKKLKLERKANGANRPKRVLTRDWVVGGATPSYAAPLRRDAREREPPADRAPLADSQSNARATSSKSNLTVPIPFTFRSELRMKSQPSEEAPLPAAIPIAIPMPDFAAAHAAADAANLARRQRAQEAFLAAQAQLESCRNSKHMIGGETARRAAERAVFDAALKVKEAESERVRNERNKVLAENEAVEIREMRRRMVPRANPVPEFYKYAPRNDTQDVEA
ncbi:targeting protein for Xklp2 protein [Rhizoctonia solani 123E]|uniref:Targeting protein for Xklp2 protein n=1 Tax=Rhizoctonia solani 123E TaxID=1423351 RepID=A0A074T0R6_9AGAM|nr:targeting protein for Xklp2 protein [Rhizoctonia solani 123E]